MNLKELANDLLSQCQELQYLRTENKRLREQVATYRESESQQLEMHQRNFGNVLETLVNRVGAKS